jgi:hypothetical protein
MHYINYVNLILSIETNRLVALAHLGERQTEVHFGCHTCAVSGGTVFDPQKRQDFFFESFLSNDTHNAHRCHLEYNAISLQDRLFCRRSRRLLELARRNHVTTSLQGLICMGSQANFRIRYMRSLISIPTFALTCMIHQYDSTSDLPLNPLP